MATKTTGNLLPGGVNTPLDARFAVDTLNDVEQMQNPVLGGIFYCKADGKHYKITALDSKLVGAITVANAKVKTYEEFGGNPEEIAALNTELAGLQAQVQGGLAKLNPVFEHYSLELGYDNVPKTETHEVVDDSGNVVYEDDGTTPKTETTRAFRCLVFGDNNAYGDAVCIFGNSNTNDLGYVFVWGNSNQTYQSQTIFGDGNVLSASVRCQVFGSMNKDNGKNAADSVIIGNMNSVEARNTFTVGFRITNRAVGGKAFGRYFTLDDAPENEYAFVLGDGGMGNNGKPEGEISFAHRVYRAIANPLYDPEKDADNTGTDSAGEKKNMPLRAYSTEYRGHLLPVTQSIAETGTVTLDHDRYARWVLTGTGAVSLQLDNWLDGDVGTVVLDTTKQTITIPDAWQTLGADITTSPGVYVLEIHQVGETVYYGILCPNQSGSGGDTESLQTQITLNYNNFLSLQNTVEQNRQSLQTQITTLNDKVDGLPQLSIVQSSSEPSNPSNGTIWIQTEEA